MYLNTSVKTVVPIIESYIVKLDRQKAVEGEMVILETSQTPSAYSLFGGESYVFVNGKITLDVVEKAVLNFSSRMNLDQTLAFNNGIETEPVIVLENWLDIPWVEDSLLDFKVNSVEDLKLGSRDKFIISASQSIEHGWDSVWMRYRKLFLGVAYFPAYLDVRNSLLQEQYSIDN